MRFLPLLLLVACSSSSEYHRGTPTAPPPAPAVRPGHGAPRVGQPGGMPRMLPPSPHKRVLPPTKEPGLWSGDQPRASVDDVAPVLLGLPLPALQSRDAADFGYSQECHGKWEKMLQTTGLQRPVEAASERARRCLAAMLFHYCVKSSEKVDRAMRANNYFDMEKHQLLPQARAAAAALEKRECTAPLSDEHDRWYAALQYEYDRYYVTSHIRRLRGEQ